MKSVSWKKTSFFPYKSHPMLVRRRENSKLAVRPSLLLCICRTVLDIHGDLLGWDVVGMDTGWSASRRRWIRDAHSVTKILLQFLVGLFFVSVKSSPGSDEPLFNNSIMLLRHTRYSKSLNIGNSIIGILAIPGFFKWSQ